MPDLIGTSRNEYPHRHNGMIPVLTYPHKIQTKYNSIFRLPLGLSLIPPGPYR